MPRAIKAKRASKSSTHSGCAHDVVYTSVSPYSRSLSYYKPPSDDAIFSAKMQTGSSTATRLPPRSSFPRVSLLPQEALDLNPREEGDTFLDFSSNRGRTTVTPSRRTIYVVDVPDVAPDISERVTRWTDPVPPEGAESNVPAPDKLRIGDIKDYLAAFYTGLDVKLLKNHFTFHTWKKGRGGLDHERGHVALVAPDGFATRIRFRPAGDGATQGQLNLNDMLDAVHASLPSDAFAMILITNHDLYDTEDDDFCAGLAYGGSRICIMSTFRYNPVLDGRAGVNHLHSWPASHCREYVDDSWEESEPALKDTEYGEERRKKKGAKVDPACMLSIKADPETPMAAAMLAARDTLVPKSRDDWYGLWLARVCRTTSHELGHCVGIGHCVYFSCAMQGSATVAEDIRQPPYLCPVCLKKMAFSLAGEPAIKSRGLEREKRSLAAEAEWVVASYRRMSAYCEERKSVGMFGALHAWLEARLKELDVDCDEVNGVVNGTMNGHTQQEDEEMGDDSVIFLGSKERN